MILLMKVMKNDSADEGDDDDEDAYADDCADDADYAHDGADDDCYHDSAEKYAHAASNIYENMLMMMVMTMMNGRSLVQFSGNFPFISAFRHLPFISGIFRLIKSSV